MRLGRLSHGKMFPFVVDLSNSVGKRQRRRRRRPMTLFDSMQFFNCQSWNQSHWRFYLNQFRWNWWCMTCTEYTIQCHLIHQFHSVRCAIVHRQNTKVLSIRLLYSQCNEVEDDDDHVHFVCCVCGAVDIRGSGERGFEWEKINYRLRSLSRRFAMVSTANGWNVQRVIEWEHIQTTIESLLLCVRVHLCKTSKFSNQK